MSKKDISKIIDKIRALRARASDEASSPSEVEAAATRAAKLMSENEVSENDLIETGVEGILEGVHNKDRKTMHPVMKVTSACIHKLTECKSLWYGGEVTYVGQPQDVEFALYLSEMIQGAANRAYKIYLRNNLIQSNAHIRKSFMTGFGRGVNSSLSVLTKRRRANRVEPKTGTDIVVLKDQLVNSYMEDKYAGITQFRGRRSRALDAVASSSGIIAGQRLNVDRPLEQNVYEGLVPYSERIPNV